MQDLDKEELEEIKVKHRMMLTRGLADFIHVSTLSRTPVFAAILFTSAKDL